MRRHNWVNVVYCYVIMVFITIVMRGNVKLGQDISGSFVPQKMMHSHLCVFVWEVELCGLCVYLRVGKRHVLQFEVCPWNNTKTHESSLLHRHEPQEVAMEHTHTLTTCTGASNKAEITHKHSHKLLISPENKSITFVSRDFLSIESFNNVEQDFSLKQTPNLVDQ